MAAVAAPPFRDLLEGVAAPADLLDDRLGLFLSVLAGVIARSSASASAASRGFRLGISRLARERAGVAVEHGDAGLAPRLRRAGRRFLVGVLRDRGLPLFRRCALACARLWRREQRRA